MTLDDFQAELRQSYVGGGPGAIVSGIVWALAAIVTARTDIATGFATLFIGGMLIFPLGTAICRYLFKRKRPDTANPGGRIVIETLPAMFVGLFIAYLFIDINPAFVFPIAAMAVGAHYFSFRTAYGDSTYWILGGLMTAIGAMGVFGNLTLPIGTAALIAFIEIVFGLWLTFRSFYKPQN
jgi:hypothetical protein